MLRCNVHGDRSEAESQILVVGGPLFARTYESGRFAFRGVTAGRVKLATAFGGQVGPARTVDLVAGKETTVTLALGAVTARPGVDF